MATVVTLAALSLLALYAVVIVEGPVESMIGSIIGAICLPFIVFLATVLVSSFCSPPESRIGDFELGPMAIG